MMRTGCHIIFTVLFLAYPSMARSDSIDADSGPFQLVARLSHPYSHKAAWSPDSRLLATVSPKTVRIWSVGKWSSSQEIPIIDLMVVPDVVFSADGATFATTHAFVPAQQKDAAFGIIDLRSQQAVAHVQSPVLKFNPNLFGVASRLFSYAGCDLVAATYQTNRFYELPISLHSKSNWNKTPLELSTEIQPHLVAFSADCQTMVTVHYPWRREQNSPLRPQEARIYHLPDGAMIRRLDLGNLGSINTAALSRDGRFLAVSNGGFIRTDSSAPLRPTGESIHLIDLQTGLETMVLDGIYSGASSLNFSSDGHWLAAALPETGSMKIAIWDTTTWQRIQTVTWACAGAAPVDFSPDARWLAAQCISSRAGGPDRMASQSSTTVIILRSPH